MLSVIIYSMSYSRISRFFSIILSASFDFNISRMQKQPSETVPPTVTIDVPTSTPAEPTLTTEPMALVVNGEGISQVEFDQEIQRFQDGLQRRGCPYLMRLNKNNAFRMN